ncbi:MAG: hypothetical protein NC097_07005 [Clostridium sp.]|nr:hypothetical protein [Prevotella sp.]MCM1429529.1 hypothetical protein [Clostridium sp.]MCM1476145.1 hypothetical protein [Muribaculaceae bacterium]
MKKIGIIVSFALLMCMIVSCADKKEKMVREFSENFAQQVGNNELDSLKMIYPAIEMADSLALEFNADSLGVEKTEKEDIYLVSFNKDAKMKVKVSEDGRMTVVETIGLFQYPQSKKKFAEKVGAFKKNSNPTDVQMAEIMDNIDGLRMKLFDEFVTRRKSAIKNLGFTTTKEPMFGMDEGKGYYTLKNTTDQPIKGDEYTITWEYYYIGFGVEESNHKIEKGVDIPANGTTRVPSSFSMHGGGNIANITMNTPTEEDFFEKFIPKGNEYAEYVKTLDPTTGDRGRLSDGPYKIKGKLGGKYPIHMTINKGMRDGSYYYDKSGPNNSLTLTVNVFNKRTGEIKLDERNAKGEITGTFSGTLTPSTFVGEMKAYTGKIYNFNLEVE